MHVWWSLTPDRVPDTFSVMSPEVVLLTTSEVAEILRVESSTVRRWAQEGLLSSISLPGGQYRFRRTDIDAILTDMRTAGAA